METLLARSAPTLFGAGREPQRASTTPTPTVRRPRQAPASRTPMRPVVVVGGVPVQLVPIGDLAQAVGRSVGHIRLLEAQGVLPPALGRRRVQGHRGWRLYRADFVAAVAAIATEERVVQRGRVMDMTTFSKRAWEAHARIHATGGRGGA